MVKHADVKKDLEKLSDFTKTPMFNYNDIHFNSSLSDNIQSNRKCDKASWRCCCH